MVGAIYDFFTLSRQVEEANIAYEIRNHPELAGRGYAGTVLPPSKPESLEKVILRTAKKNHGAVTPGEVALEGDFSVDEAKKALEKMAAAGNAEMRVRSSGVVVYVFPEFSEGGKDDYIA
jgi:hypothetical protein